MPFWSTNFRDTPLQKDPKRNFRFTVEFDGIDSEQGGGLAWYAKKVLRNPALLLKTLSMRT